MLLLLYSKSTYIARTYQKRTNLAVPDNNALFQEPRSLPLSPFRRSFSSHFPPAELYCDLNRQGESHAHDHAAFNLTFHAQRIDRLGKGMGRRHLLHGSVLIQRAQLGGVSVGHMGYRDVRRRSSLKYRISSYPSHRFVHLYVTDT